MNLLHKSFLPLGLSVLLAASFSPAFGNEGDPSGSAPLAIDFATDIRPIFATSCYECHGPERMRGGLRLDHRSMAMEGGDSGRVILPGNAGESLLYRFISGLDPDTTMPEQGDPLPEKQIAQIKSWIDAGAEWPQEARTTRTLRSSHWSFQPPERPDPPAVDNEGWVRNPIDNFILERLEQEEVDPSPEADRTRLIRRLSLDLTGLPPAPEEIEAFLSDSSEDAYERLVDRLLESPHFGEQWARHWLDLARYADSDGYEKDFYRPHAWRWRDWVIDSINRDQPFDEFTRDQIAGDLLPEATLEQRVATGFHRNTLLNREGGVDIREDRVIGVVDRVNAVGTAWLGLTVSCAECHTHKYDPLTQREYYTFYAFFNNTDDRDIRAPLPEQISAFEKGKQKFEAARQKYVETEIPGFDVWVETVADLPDIWFVPQVEDYELPTFGANNGANLYYQEDGSFLATGMVRNNTHYIMMLNTDLDGITGIRVEALTDDMLPNMGPGWAGNGNFVLSELEVEASPLSDVSRLQAFSVSEAAADYSQETLEVEKAIDGDRGTGWAVDLPHLPLHAVDRAAVFTLAGDIGFEGGTRLKVSLVQHGGNSHTLGRVRVSYTTEERSLLNEQIVPDRIRALARTPAAERTLDGEVTLRRYFHTTFDAHNPALIAYSEALADSPHIQESTRAQVLQERSTPRTTNVHVRGNFLDKGAEVEPGVFSVLHPFEPRGERADRIDLAAWITDPANPLTGRVTVNHFWMHLFGEGLVTTMGDFGAEGEKPSHPELLDWLATEFLRQDWSRKELIRLIVSSAAYRQSSDTREDLLHIDANNRLLARQSRLRLSAENVRDQFLAAGGILDRSIGGASVVPDTKRRGLYLQTLRSDPHYMLATFDAPASVQACTQRERSNTPLQALTLLNSPLFVQSAQAFSQRIIQEAPADAAERIRYAFQVSLGPEPEQDDVDDFDALLQQLRTIYSSEPEAAKDVTEDFPVESEPAAEAAAWVVLARTILNLDELVTRE